MKFQVQSILFLAVLGSALAVPTVLPDGSVTDGARAKVDAKVEVKLDDKSLEKTKGNAYSNTLKVASDISKFIETAKDSVRKVKAVFQSLGNKHKEETKGNKDKTKDIKVETELKKSKSSLDEIKDKFISFLNSKNLGFKGSDDEAKGEAENELLKAKVDVKKAKELGTKNVKKNKEAVKELQTEIKTDKAAQEEKKLEQNLQVDKSDQDSMKATMLEIEKSLDM